MTALSVMMDHQELEMTQYPTFERSDITSIIEREKNVATWEKINNLIFYSSLLAAGIFMAGSYSVYMTYALAFTGLSLLCGARVTKCQKGVDSEKNVFIVSHTNERIQHIVQNRGSTPTKLTSPSKQTGSMADKLALNAIAKVAKYGLAELSIKNDLLAKDFDVFSNIAPREIKQKLESTTIAHGKVTYKDNPAALQYIAIVEKVYEAYRTILNPPSK